MVKDKSTGRVVKKQIADQQAVTSQIRGQLLASKTGESDILKTGINIIQQSRFNAIAENVDRLRAVSGATGISTRSPDALIDAIRSGDSSVEDDFFEALTATRSTLGFSDYSYRPEIIQKTGMSRLMRAGGTIADAQKEEYADTLARAGIPNALEDAHLRRAAVELATITSGVPYSVTPEGDVSQGFAKRVIQSLGKTMSEEEMSTRVGAFNANTGRKMGDYLSELGVSFVQTQKSNYIFGKSGKISRPILSTDLLKKIDVTVPDGSGGRKTVKFLSEEFLSDQKFNKFGLSVAQREEGRVVNLVYGNLAADTNNGQRVISRGHALELAKGYTDQLDELFESNSIADLVDQGYFELEDQAKEVKQAVLSDRKNFIAELSDSFSSRGVVTARAVGDTAEGVAAFLENMSRGLDNDVVAFQRQMQFVVSEFGEDYAAFQLRIDDNVIDVLESSGKLSAQEIQDIRDGTYARRAYDLYLSTMARSEEDSGFVSRVSSFFSRKGVDKGFRGTNIGRSMRDANVMEFYEKVKPKVGIGLAAVGLLSAGYYIAKKNRQNDLYDQVMEQQPTEGRGNNRILNDSYMQQNPQRSTRRDPLVTAGVVGNLDRNKVNHTRMGPNKYDYLYGS
jgi:hypothetical protein